MRSRGGYRRRRKNIGTVSSDRGRVTEGLGIAVCGVYATFTSATLGTPHWQTATTYRGHNSYTVAPPTEKSPRGPFQHPYGPPGPVGSLLIINNDKSYS